MELCGTPQAELAINHTPLGAGTAEVTHRVIDHLYLCTTTLCSHYTTLSSPIYV